MNKLVLDKEKMVLSDAEGIIIASPENKEIIFKGKNKVVLETLKNDLNLKFVLEDNASLDISLFFKDKNVNSNIIIEQNNNTNFVYKESIASNKECKINIINNIWGNNNKSLIKIRGISYQEKININVLANVNEKSFANELVEDIKGINHGGEVVISPNMEVNTCEVMANHYVAIGKITDEDLFYLESKGLSKENSENLILNGFLKSIMEVI